MFRSFLSWRYLTSRFTNLIGICGLFVAVGALIMILSIMTGFLQEQKKAIRGGLADVVIAPDQEGLRRGGDSDEPDEADDPDDILALLEDEPRIVAAAPHLRWFGMLLGEDGVSAGAFVERATLGSVPLVELIGIDLELEFEATELRAYLEEEPLRGQRVQDPSRPFEPPSSYRPDGRPFAGVILGEQLLDLRGLHRGDVINIGTLVPEIGTGELADRNRKFVIAGSFRSKENETDLARIYMERDELRSLIGDVRRYSEILVKLEDYDRDAEQLCIDLEQRLYEAGLIRGLTGEVRTWEDFKRTMLGAIKNERVLMAIMLSLVLLVACFTVFAILSMMVTEKRRDIGILTAIGATPTGVLSLFLRIALWDALIGVTAGAIAGTLIALNIDDIEKWLSKKLGVQIFDRTVYYFDEIPAVVDPLWVAVISAGAVTATLLFAAIPAWRASRQDPLESLRSE